MTVWQRVLRALDELGPNPFLYGSGPARRSQPLLATEDTEDIPIDPLLTTASDLLTELAVATRHLTDTTKLLGEEIAAHAITRMAVITTSQTLERQLRELRQDLQSQTNAAGQAIAERERVAKDLDETMTENANLKRQVARLERSRDNFEKAFDTLKKKSKKLPKQLEKETERADGLERELEETKKQATDLQQELHKTTRRTDNLKASKAEALRKKDDKIKELTANADEAWTEVADLKEEIDELQAKIDDLETRSEESDSDYDRGGDDYENEDSDDDENATNPPATTPTNPSHPQPTMAPSPPPNSSRSPDASDILRSSAKKASESQLASRTILPLPQRMNRPIFPQVPLISAPNEENHRAITNPFAPPPAPSRKILPLRQRTNKPLLAQAPLISAPNEENDSANTIPSAPLAAPTSSEPTPDQPQMAPGNAGSGGDWARFGDDDAENELMAAELG